MKSLGIFEFKKILWELGHIFMLELWGLSWGLKDGLWYDNLLFSFKILVDKGLI